MNRLSDAEHEMNSITNKNPVDQETLAFLNYCADRYYRKSQDSKAKGKAELAAKEAQAALLIYKKLGAITPDNPDVQIRLAELYVNNNQAENAEALYRKKLEQDPSSADAMYQLGLLYEKQNHWQDAFDVWQKLARGLKQGTPAWFEARYREAWSLDKLGKKTDACEVIAATKVRFQDFGNGEYGPKFLQLNSALCDNK
jgi:tetratricopeptide (TPR) repeat protein